MLIRISQILYITFLFSLIILPMCIIGVFAFTNSSWHFSLCNFTTIFHHSEYLLIVKRSLVIGTWTTGWCLVIAYPIAYFISKLPVKKQNFYLLLIIIPMWTNFLLRTTAWVKILGTHGLINYIIGLFGFSPISFLYNEKAIIFGMVYNLLPFMILPIYNAMNKINPAYIEASYDLGASPIQTFYRIILPLSLNGVKNGIFLVFVPCITFFAVSELLGGVKSMMLGNLINQIFFFLRDWHLGASFSMLLIIMLLVFTVIFNIKNFFKNKKDEVLS